MPDNITIPVLFEDRDIIVIDKPAGVVVNRAESVSGQTVADWVETYHPLPKDPSLGSPSDQITQEFTSRSGIVHRIDKETSGILLIAKHPAAFAALKEQFSGRSVLKTYTTLVHGIVSPKEGEIRAPLGRLPWNRKRFGVLPDGRPALTSYRAETYYQKGDVKTDTYSLVTVMPKTGRTHQIRVHLHHLNHPVVSDPLYAGKKRLKSDSMWCPRLFLHASAIQFMHPASGTRMNLTSNLPVDIQNALRTLTPL